MNKQALIFGLFLFALIGCNTNKKKSPNAPVKKSGEAPSEVIQNDSLVVHSISNSPLDTPYTIPPAMEEPAAPVVVISFQKTPCFGQCPVFEARIYTDGKIIYRGERFVDRVGVFQTQLDTNVLNDLESKLVEIGFLDMAEVYPEHGNRIPDLPSTILLYQKGTTRKKVINNHNAPKALLDFEAELTSLMEGLEWFATEGDR